jgi:lipopolysaccharide heptosyltransferase II
MPTSSPWAQATNLLCVRLDSIGDVLMTTPAIRALRESVPGRRITLLTSPSGAEAARLVPDIDDVIVYEAPWMKAGGGHDPVLDFALIDDLRPRSFDAAVIFTVFSQSPLPAAMACYLAAIPLRLAHCHENPYRLLTDWVPDPEPAGGIRHEVQRQLDLVATVGATTADHHLSLAIPLAARREAARLLHEAGVSGSDYVVIHPGATAPSRRYPSERFAEIVAALSAHRYQCVITGGGHERELARQVAGMPSINVAGQLDLPTLAAVIGGARLLISNNTGPVHIAAAVGTPVVDLYALTNPQHTPWMIPARVLSNDVPCRWCYRSVCPEGHHLCLQGISASEVVDAALSLLAEVDASPATARV